MKRLFIVICFFAAMQPVARAQEVSITYQQFYNDLEPYGRWINYPSYGYVWAPYFERPDYFTPYSSGGHWVYTDYGWTWVSDYEWGWATFHYGRWFYDDYLGWCWIPGYEWAPAWVTWGSYGGNYGWAPLGPGISISVGMRWRPPNSYWWTFVPCNRFGGSDWNRYIVRNNTTIVNRVTIINNVYQGPGGGQRSGGWMRGPGREDVARFTRRPVQPVAFNNVSRPEVSRVQNNRLSIYRPTVDRSGPGAQAIRPGRAEALATARPETRLPVHSQDRQHNNPGNNRPGIRPANPQPPARPGNPETPGNPARPPGQRDRPDRPYPNNPRPPVNPGTRPENRPGNPPPQQDNRPPVPPPPGNRPEPRPDRPVPERPANRPPNNRPAQPGNRPANPQPPSRPGNPETPGNRPDHHNMPPPNRPGIPPGNRPAMPPNQNPGAPPNRPVTPPEHRDAPPPVRPPGRKDDVRK